MHVDGNQRGDRERNPLSAKARTMIMIDRNDTESMLWDIFLFQNL